MGVPCRRERGKGGARITSVTKRGAHLLVISWGGAIGRAGEERLKDHEGMRPRGEGEGGRRLLRRKKGISGEEKGRTCTDIGGYVRKIEREKEGLHGCARKKRTALS